MADGKIVQCIGAVVDVEFPRNAMPKVFDALKMAGSELTLEVQQQLGDGIVRTIALGSSDGLRRGMMIQNTGNPITVPVGKATLGRIMDVLGNPIDECGPVSQERTLVGLHLRAGCTKHHRRIAGALCRSAGVPGSRGESGVRAIGTDGRDESCKRQRG